MVECCLLSVYMGETVRSALILLENVIAIDQSDSCIKPYEPRREKTGLRGFRPGPTQTGLYSHRRWLEA